MLAEKKAAEEERDKMRQEMEAKIAELQAQADNRNQTEA
jgi:hypothetical protein